MAASAENVVVAGFTEDQAHRLTQVSLRQLRYWARDGFFVPSLSAPDATPPGLRLYSFRDLTCLKVISHLRNESKASLQHLREVKAKLEHLGEDMWSKTTLYVLNRRVLIRNPETGSPEDAVTGQGVLSIPLAAVSNDMREAIHAMRSRPADSYGKIDTKTRGARNPIVAGTRIPIRSIKDLADDGLTPDEIVNQYPSLTRTDVEAALAYRLAA
jgi:uncharacterized protein (DUF433 family)